MRGGVRSRGNSGWVENDGEDAYSRGISLVHVNFFFILAHSFFVFFHSRGFCATNRTLLAHFGAYRQRPKNGEDSIDIAMGVWLCVGKVVN